MNGFPHHQTCNYAHNASLNYVLLLFFGLILVILSSQVNELSSQLKSINLIRQLKWSTEVETRKKQREDKNSVFCNASWYLTLERLNALLEGITCKKPRKYLLQ